MTATEFNNGRRKRNRGRRNSEVFNGIFLNVPEGITLFRKIKGIEYSTNYDKDAPNGGARIMLCDASDILPAKCFECGNPVPINRVLRNSIRRNHNEYIMPDELICEKCENPQIKTPKAPKKPRTNVSRTKNGNMIPPSPIRFYE